MGTSGTPLSKPVLWSRVACWNSTYLTRTVQRGSKGSALADSSQLWPAGFLQRDGYGVVHGVNHVSRLNALLQTKNEVGMRQAIWKMASKSTHVSPAWVCQLQESLYLNTSCTVTADLRAVVPKQVTAWYHSHEVTCSVTFLWPLSGADIHRITFLPQTVLWTRRFRIKRAYCIEKMLSPLLKYSWGDWTYVLIL